MSIQDMLDDPAGVTCKASYDAGDDNTAAACYNTTTVGRGEVPIGDLYTWAWRADVWSKWRMASTPPSANDPDSTADWSTKVGDFVTYRAAVAITDLVNKFLAGQGAFQTVDLDDPDMTNKLQKLVQEGVMTAAERDEMLALADDKLTLSGKHLGRDVTAQELGEHRIQNP